MAYSARYIAASKPIGIATHIAIIVINKVPVKTGIAPNDPEAATWSSLRAICGDHVVPKKNSKGETSEKNFRVSNNNDNTIPSVTIIAINDAININTIKILSILFLALRSGFILRITKNKPMIAMPKVAINLINSDF